LWGGWIKLSNGWVFELPQMNPAPRLPISVEARRIEA
jgi:nitrogen fixation protein NifT